MGPQRKGIGAATAAFAVVAVVVIAGVGYVALTSSPGHPSSSGPSPSGGTYEVTFLQTAACSGSFWGAPWGVTINGLTKTQPPGTATPILQLGGTTDGSLSEIDFFLQGGEYRYSITPSGGYLTPASGSFAVAGHNVTIPIAFTGTSCTTTSAPAPPSASPVPISTVETATVPIGGAPRTIAVDPATGMVYVADYFSNSLTVVDSATDSVVARIPLPAGNDNGVAVDPNTNMVYVLVEGGVAVINGTTNEVVGDLPFDFMAGSLAYDPSTQTIYASSAGGAGTLIGVDAETRSVVLNTTLGYPANSVAVDPLTHLVFAAGCDQTGLVCGSVVSVVDGVSGKLVNRVALGNYAYPRVAIDSGADAAFVSGSAQIVELNGTTGDIVYSANSLVCGPLDSMATDPSSGVLLAVSLDYNYILAYDGTTGALVNMYSFPSPPQYVTFDPQTDVWYTSVGGQLLSFRSGGTIGNVDSSLTGSGQGCALP